MTNSQVLERYFQWLIDQACTYREKKDYEQLFRTLFATTFRYSIRRDANRAADGVDLRSMFAEECGIDFETRHSAISGPCSVLELLIGMAKRAAFSMIDDEMTDEDDAIHWIFWIMMENLGLVGLKNAHFSHSRAMRRVDVFMDRKYAENGSKGGLFVVNKPRKDLREVELWNQMCWFISERLNWD